MLLLSMSNSVSCLNPGPTAFPDASSVWPSSGSGPSFGEKPTPTPDLVQNYISVWWMAMLESVGWTSSRSMNQRTSGGRWPGIRSDTAVIRSAFWRTKSAAAARHWLFAKCMASICPVLGKPPKVPDLSRQAKKQEYQDSCNRNAVEGAWGTVKTAYGLDRVIALL